MCCVILLLLCCLCVLPCAVCTLTPCGVTARRTRNSAMNSVTSVHAMPHTKPRTNITSSNTATARKASHVGQPTTASPVHVHTTNDSGMHTHTSATSSAHSRHATPHQHMRTREIRCPCWFERVVRAPTLRVFVVVLSHAWCHTIATPCSSTLTCRCVRVSRMP